MELAKFLLQAATLFQVLLPLSFTVIKALLVVIKSNLKRVLAKFTEHVATNKIALAGKKIIMVV